MRLLSDAKQVVKVLALMARRHPHIPLTMTLALPTMIRGLTHRQRIPLNEGEVRQQALPIGT